MIWLYVRGPAFKNMQHRSYYDNYSRFELMFWFEMDRSLDSRFQSSSLVAPTDQVHGWVERTTMATWRILCHDLQDGCEHLDAYSSVQAWFWSCQMWICKTPRLSLFVTCDCLWLFVNACAGFAACWIFLWRGEVWLWYFIQPYNINRRVQYRSIFIAIAVMS